MDNFPRDSDRVAEFLRHEPCPNCGSSDANAVYSDGHTYCFSCHFYTSGVGDPGLLRPTMSERVLLRGHAVRLRKRGISADTCERYKIYTDGNVVRFYYHDRSGAVVGCKVRDKDKNFHYEGETDGSFFGQHLYANKGTRVVITEGEFDAASFSEFYPSWAYVSLPTGAAGAKKSCQKNLDWLQGYDEIVLMFDDDEPGREAAIAAASVLPPGKVKIGKVKGYKDASDALQAEDLKALKDAVFQAEEYRPDGIVDGKTLLELVTTPNPPNDYDYPYSGLNTLLHGIRYGELVTCTAGSGIGKSSFMRSLATSLLQAGESVGYLALEESNRRTALGLMSVASGKPLHLGNFERSDLTQIYEDTLAKWNLYLFDGFGSFDPDIIYNRIEYLSAGLDCKVIFLDHLSILLSGLDGDERRVIDQTMTRLRSLVERTGIALFLVSHLRRTQTDQAHEDGNRVSLGQLRGSASIAQLSDSVIALERNQQDRSEQSLTTVRVLKNRHSGETGIACKLRYDLSTCRFIEDEIEPDFDATTDF